MRFVGFMQGQDFALGAEPMMMSVDPSTLAPSGSTGAPAVQTIMRTDATGRRIDLPRLTACPTANDRRWASNPNAWVAEAMNRDNSCLCEMRAFVRAADARAPSIQYLDPSWLRTLRTTHDMLNRQRGGIECAWERQAARDTELETARYRAEQAQTAMAAQARIVEAERAKARAAEAAAQGQSAEASRLRQLSAQLQAEAEALRAKAKELPGWALPTAGAAALALLLFLRR